MILKILAVMLAAVIVIAACVIFVRTKNLTFKSRKKLIARTLRIRCWMIAAIVVFTSCVVTGFYAEREIEQEAIITLNYMQASKAQNSNGTRYDMQEIICDEVLKRAIDKGGFEDVTVQDLRRCLSVKPVVQGKSENEAEYHISTEFSLLYKSNRQTMHLNSKNLVQMIGEAYREFYIDKYADDFSIIDFQVLSAEELKDMEYTDIIDFLQKQSANITGYMYQYGNENASFISSTGESFYSLAEKISNLDKELIDQNLRSYVYYNGIAKDPKSYINRLKYENMMLDYDKQRASGSFETRNAAVKMYAPEMTRVVLVPTKDKDGKFYMGRTKVGIDQLSEEAETYSKEAKGYTEQINFNKYQISKIENSSFKGGNQASLDQMIDDIQKLLIQYAKDASILGQEYSETQMNDCISVSVQQISFLMASLILVLFIGSFLLAMILCQLGYDLSAHRKAAQKAKAEDCQREGAAS